MQERQPFEERLVGLWLAYAAFERKLRQWKQARSSHVHQYDHPSIQS